MNSYSESDIRSEDETNSIDEIETLSSGDGNPLKNDEINDDSPDAKPEKGGTRSDNLLSIGLNAHENLFECWLGAKRSMKKHSTREGDTKNISSSTLEGSENNQEATSDSVVSLKGVSKHYGNEENLIRALDNVDLEIRKGAVVSIMGPSGSGKSTLINMIGSLDVPTQGEVAIDGTNLENMSHKELTKYRSDKVGFIFQSFNLLPNLTALENVELPMEFNEHYREERRQRAEKLLKSIGMTKRADHFPASLSGGEKQRIAIARALANTP